MGACGPVALISKSKVLVTDSHCWSLHDRCSLKRDEDSMILFNSFLATGPLALQITETATPSMTKLHTQ